MAARRFGSDDYFWKLSHTPLIHFFADKMEMGESQNIAPSVPIELSIVLVNWNSIAYLRECLASIYEYTTDLAFEVVVVDNASPEGGLEALGNDFPGATIIRSAKNLGFAGANNVGFQNSSGTFVLFLNPDTKLVGPAVSTMLKYMKTLPDAGIIGCKLLNSDLSISPTSYQKFPTILNQVMDVEFLQVHWPNCRLWELGPLYSNDKKAFRVEVIPGACMLIRCEVFQRVGMFSEDYFMYAEDLDLNYKIWREGLTNYYVSEAAIIHHGGKSSSRTQRSNWATTMKYRAMMKYYLKRRGRAYGFMYRIAMGAAATFRLVILLVVFPFGNKGSIRSALSKWSAVLKWAVSRQNMVLEDR
jgi:GT2 family glycosyltransferase